MSGVVDICNAIALTKNQFEACRLQNQEVFEELNSKLQRLYEAASEGNKLKKLILGNIYLNMAQLVQDIDKSKASLSSGDFNHFGIMVGEIVQLSIFGKPE